MIMKNGKTNGNHSTENEDYKLRQVVTQLTPTEFQESYSSGQEPIFPPELQLSSELENQYLVFRGANVTWYRPTKLDQLLQLKSYFPNAKIVVGNTEVALEMKFKHCDYTVLIHPTLIPEILVIERTPNSLNLGGAVTLSQFQSILQLDVKELAETQSRTSAALLEMLHWFAGKQIRNVASVAGNIMTGSPISDLNPLFMASGCTLTLQSRSLGIRKVKMDEHFFTGYRRNIVAPDEVLIKIEIPRTQADEYIIGYKQSRRREDDIAIVNAGLRVLFHPGTSKVKDATIVFGGMAPVTVMAIKTMEKLMDRNWEDPSLVENVCSWILDEIPLEPSVPG